ncbi:MAG: hypothetical protein GX665_12395 [Gammaproteobacteria bacterium]|nr:hypothetical protein [Gammaproteobacteria bacterium]
MSEESGHYGNRNAAKPESEKATQPVHFRTSAANKAHWEGLAAAAGKSLSRWIQDQLPRPPEK